MFWNKKDKQQEQVEKPYQGIFRTDWHPIKRNIARSLAVTFQRGVEDIIQVDGDGNKLAKSTFAMDDNCNMTTAKMVSARPIGIPEVQLSWFADQGFIGYQTCALMSQNWLVDKACTMPAKDATRNGFEITVNDGTEVDPEVLEFMRKQDKKYGLMRNCVEFVRNGRIFGIRVALFEVESTDKDYYYKPFNPDGVKKGSYKGISQIDPYWISPVLGERAASNPAARDFYEPTWWIINGEYVHRTHLVIMRNGELPDILKPSYIYGGMPVPQRIAERVYAAERTANEGPLLTMSKRLTVMKTDMSKVEANQEGFEAAMNVWTSFMNNFGVKIVGGDDEIQQFDTSLADVDAVIMTQYQLVAAAAGVPATKLMGTSPKGFNATGEFEEASYHEELESIQEHDLTPLIDRHHLLLIRSEVAPKFSCAPFSVEINWKPVDSPTAGEVAEVNYKKAQADALLVSTGGISGEDVRSRLISDKDSGYNGMEVEVDLGGEEELYGSIAE